MLTGLEKNLTRPGMPSGRSRRKMACWLEAPVKAFQGTIDRRFSQYTKPHGLMALVPGVLGRRLPLSAAFQYLGSYILGRSEFTLRLRR